MAVRALFFPWSAGGGAGYTGRCLAVATRLAGRYECAFGPDCVISMVEEAGFPVVGPRERHQPRTARPEYLPFANVERVWAVAARYYRADTVRADVERDRAVIAEYRPDVVVIDMQPTAAIAARGLGVPVVSLADTDFLSTSPVAWMPWLKRDPAQLMPYPSCVPNFNEALAEAGRDPVDSAIELLWGDATIVASCPELEPPPQPPRGRRPPIYAGPLYWDPAGSNGEPPPANGHRRVYVTLGSGSMVGRELLQRVLDALDGPELQVYVSVGLHPDGELSPPANARVDGFTGLTRALRWSDVVLSHGGYSTVVAASALARPQVVLPLMSEQETNGREMVERVGTGLLVRKTVDDPAARRLG